MLSSPTPRTPPPPPPPADLTIAEAETLLVDLLMDGRLPADAALNQSTGVLSLAGAHCAAPAQRFSKVAERVPGRNTALGSHGDRYGAMGALAGKVQGMVDGARDTLARMLSNARDAGGRAFGEEGGAEWGGGRKGGGGGGGGGGGHHRHHYAHRGHR